MNLVAFMVQAIVYMVLSGSGQQAAAAAADGSVMLYAQRTRREAPSLQWAFLGCCHMHKASPAGLAMSEEPGGQALAFSLGAP